MRVITFLSDYAVSDEFAGVCRAVIERISPGARVIDVAHGVRGVRAGAAALAQSVSFAPADAVHLAIVDPGVGTTRRGIVVVSLAGAMLVGPDNGLLVGAAHALGGVEEAYELREPMYRLKPVSPTFHGRDVFAPAAAHLAAGVAPSALGPPLVPPPVELPEPHVVVGDGVLDTDVLRADSFGNVQLAATWREMGAARLGPRVLVLCDAGEFEAAVATTFASVGPGRLAALVDSGGHVSLAVNLGSAARLLGDPARVRLQAVRW